MHAPACMLLHASMDSGMKGELANAKFNRKDMQQLVAPHIMPSRLLGGGVVSVSVHIRMCACMYTYECVQACKSMRVRLTDHKIGIPHRIGEA